MGSLLTIQSPYCMCDENISIHGNFTNFYISDYILHSNSTFSYIFYYNSGGPTCYIF